MDETPADSGQTRDQYLPDFLLPYMPANPSLRDLIMGSVAIAASAAFGIIALQFLHRWIGIAIMSVGVGYFTIHYWLRVWDRTERVRGKKK
jgi:hypothetical protein